MEGASLIGPGGLSIDLIATDYNADTLEVTYQLRERPVPGDYVFSLSGDVRDHADLSVVGDGLGTGYALSFTLDIAPLPTAEVEPNGTVGAAQDLGPLYAAELRDGVVIDGVVDASGDQDYYRFEVTRQGLYTFRLISETRGQTGQLLLRDAEGNLLAQGIRFPGAGSVLFRFLKAGSYIVQMDGLGVPDGEAYSLSIQSAADAETPLVDSYTGPSVSVVLSTRDGERAPASRQASTSSVPIIVAGEAIAYSVRFVPTVGSQPVGRAQAPSAAETEFAWADMSAAKRVLPAGIYLGRRVETATQYSVASVSGSFLEPLPEIVFDGASTSDATLQVAAEFRAALRAWRAGETPEAGPEIIEAVAFRFRGSRNGSDPSGEEVHAHQDADAPSGWAFGMVASLSVVGASSTQNRRRTANWVRQTFEWIGID
jgi:hypothetical protein